MQLRRGGRGGHRRREMPGLADHVEDQPGRGHGGQAAQHGRPGQPVRVGLGQHRVPDPGQKLARPAGSRSAAIASPTPGASRSTQPTTPATRPPRSRPWREHLGRLARLGHGLHQHGGGHALGRGLGLEVRQQEVAAQRVQAGLIEPRLRPHGQVPDVVVRIDDGHGRSEAQVIKLLVQVGPRAVAELSVGERPGPDRDPRGTPGRRSRNTQPDAMPPTRPPMCACQPMPGLRQQHGELVGEAERHHRADQHVDRVPVEEPAHHDVAEVAEHHPAGARPRPMPALSKSQAAQPAGQDDQQRSRRGTWPRPR